MSNEVRKVPIKLMLAKVMEEKGVGTNELARRVGMTSANMSNIKMVKCRGVKFRTLDKLCEELACQPGDLLSWIPFSDDECIDVGDAS